MASHGDPPGALSRHSFLKSLNITDASEALGFLGRERELYPDLGFRYTSDTRGRGERDGSWAPGNDKRVLRARDSLVAVAVLTLSLAYLSLPPPPIPHAFVSKRKGHNYTQLCDCFLGIQVLSSFWGIHPFT